MTAAQIDAALVLVREESDLNAKALLLAALVSELFREHGFEPVIVGGSAIEFYTDGAYMSGDTDICWADGKTPTLEEREQIMRQIPGIEELSAKNWQYDGLWIDLLGDVDFLARKDFATIETPTGIVLLIPVEDALVGRVFAARCWTGYNQEDHECAKKLMTAALSGSIQFDWAEASRIAGSPKYGCLSDFEAVRAEVEAELANRAG